MGPKRRRRREQKGKNARALKKTKASTCKGGRKGEREHVELKGKKINLVSRTMSAIKGGKGASSRDC